MSGGGVGGVGWLGDRGWGFSAGEGVGGSGGGLVVLMLVVVPVVGVVVVVGCGGRG